MAGDRLNDPPEDLTAQNWLDEWRERDTESRREALSRVTVPYGVDTRTQTFYFGPETPTEESWEVSGEWVEKDGQILISEISVFPSRRISDPGGEFRLRDPESVPDRGLNRDIVRRFGTDAPIRRAIRKQIDAEAARVESELDDEHTSEWAADLVERSRAMTARAPGSRQTIEWWVARADEYLAVANALRSTYGVQAQLADDSTGSYWGVGIAGTRWRVKRLREMGLIDDTGPVPTVGPNHPRRKGTNNG